MRTANRQLTSWLSLEDRITPALNFGAVVFESDSSFGSRTVAVDTDAAGNTYAVGLFSGETDFDPSNDAEIRTSVNQDYFVAKYTPSGELAWVRQLRSQQQNARRIDLAVSNAGNIAVVADLDQALEIESSSGFSTTINSTGNTDVAFLRWDTTGNLIAAQTIGGSFGDFASSIAVSDEQIVISGKFLGTVDFDLDAGVASQTATGLGSSFIVSYDWNGAYRWVRSWNGDIQILQTVIDSNQAVHWTGFFAGTIDFDPGAGSAPLVNNSFSYYWGFAARLNAAGLFERAFVVGSAPNGANGGSRAFRIAVDDNEQIVIGGRFSGTVDFDPSSAIVQKTALTKDGVDLVEGYTFLAAYDYGGNLRWVEQFGTERSSDERGLDLAIDASGAVITTGTTLGNYSFDTNQNIIPAGGYVLKLDAQGKFLWARSFQSDGRVDPYSIAVGPEQSLLIGGLSLGSSRLRPGDGGSIWSSSGLSGWITQLTTAGEFALAVPPSPPPPPPPLPPSPIAPRDQQLVVIVDGTVQVYVTQPGGGLSQTGSFTAFPGIGGVVRGAVGDFDGDGQADQAVVTGPGGGGFLRILGANGGDLLGITDLFPGENLVNVGLFVAAGDINGDGRDEIIVTPDLGGGPRVRVFQLNGGQLIQLADYFGIDDPNFRGGARVGVGDLDGDNQAELVVSAGFGGGPRIAIFSGASVTNGSPSRLVNDFFAFESTLRNGAFVTVGDFDGDGRGELVFGGGPGGGPRVLSIRYSDLLASGSDAAIANSFANLFAFDAEERGGVRLAVKDVDGDGRLDLITGSGEGQSPGVRVFRSLGNTLSTSPSDDLSFGGLPTAFGVFVG